MLNLYIGKEKKLFHIRTKLLYYKVFHRRSITIKMRKTQVLMNKSVYFSLSVLDLSKTVIMNLSKTLLYGYRQLSCSYKNRWYLQRYCRRWWSKIWHSNFELDRRLPKGKNKKVIELMKDELGGQIMKEFVRLIAKSYSYLKDSNDESKKAKDTKKCIIKRKIEFQDYKNCLEAAQIENIMNHLEKSSNDDKRCAVN